MVDPLRDPDDPELLDPYRARELAGLVEAARLAAGAVRYGKVGRVGVAQVVVNRDNPLPGGNHACAVYGSSAEVAGTLMQLEQTFADVGRAEAVLYASPTTVAEIEGIADDTGWHAVEESLAVVHRGEVERSPLVRPARDADLEGIAELLADDLGVDGTRLLRHLGQRLDDPRCVFVVVDDGGPTAESFGGGLIADSFGGRSIADSFGGGRIGGFASGFGDQGVGLVEHAVVRPARRRRGLGRALVGGAVVALQEAGARLVASHVAEGGAGERFVEACGFEVCYPVTAYARRVDELLD